MMRLNSTFGRTGPAMAAAAALLLAASFGYAADKVYLKNGKVLEGKIQRQESSFVVLALTVDGKETTQMIAMDEVKKIEKDDASKPAEITPAEAKPAADKPADAKPADAKGAMPDGVASGTSMEKLIAKAGKADPNAKAKKAEKITGRPTRVAVLDFGIPAREVGEVENMVGVHIAALAYERVLPILEREKVDVVVFRVNSGGGYSFERTKLSALFQNVFKPKFRVAAWIESAISAAAMSPWVIEEFYMMPNGAIGACTEWHGPLILSDPMSQATILNQMKDASGMGGHNYLIMRSMEICEPLSANIEEDGSVTLLPNLQGQVPVNYPNEILTLNAPLAEKIGFSKGTAATLPELMKAMKIEEYEVVAKDASRQVDEFARSAQRTTEEAREVAQKYLLAINTASNLQVRSDRIAEAMLAQKYLKQMERWVQENPVFEFHIADKVRANLTTEWFDQQKRAIKELMR
ncbi:hypothetical protein BH11PLA1_BH11PLA1_24490 [soil metagenome]